MGVSRYVAREIMKEIGNRSKEFYEFVLPPVDIYEDGTELVIVIDLPGFQKKDIHVNIAKDILTIRAKRVIDIESHTIHFSQRPNKIEKRYLCLFRYQMRIMQTPKQIMQTVF